MNSAPVLLFVVGMHRSGTSALARALHALGAAVGDALLDPQPGVNEQGFWEHHELVAIDEALLERLGRPWYDFRPLPRTWWEDPGLASLHRRARRFLQQTFGHSPLTVLKDPRLCRLLPFWLQAAEGFSVRILLAQRDPRAVVASLCRRDPVTPQAAVLLWLVHQREAERHATLRSHTRLDYDALLADPVVTLRRVGEALALNWPVAPETAQLDRLLDPALRHHRAQTPPDDEALALALEIHQRLLDEAPTDALWARLEQWQADCALWLQGLAEATDRAMRLGQQLGTLGQAHTEALETVRRRDHELAERTRQWQDLGRDLEHCRKVVRERDRQLAERTRQWQDLGRDLEHCRQVVQDRDHRLAHLQRWQARVQDHPLVRLLTRLGRIPRA